VDSRLNPTQTPVEAPGKWSLDPNPDSTSETPPQNPDSGALTIEVDKPCVITIQTPSDAKKKSRLHSQLITCDEFARLEDIDKRTIGTWERRGKVHRLATGQLAPNGKPEYVIPVAQLSASGLALWRRERGGQTLDSTGRGTGTEASLGLAPQTANGDACRQATYIEHERAAGQAPSNNWPRGEMSEAGASIACPAPASSPLADSRCREVARFNADGIPILATDPRRVWEAGLVACRSPRCVEDFNRRRAAVLDLELAQARVDYGQNLDAARRVAHHHHVSWRTLLTWQRCYRKHGEPGLVPRWKRTEGSRTIPKRLQAQLEAFYAQAERPSFMQCYRFAADWWLAERERTGKQLDCPSYHAVRRHLESIIKRRPALIEACRLGPDRFRDRYEFVVNRDERAMALNECWVLDHRCMDTHVILPSGEIGRPWLTAVSDIHSADFVGFVLREKDQVTSDAVACAMATMGVEFHAVTIDSPVLDLSRRSDLASVKAALADVEVHL